MKTKLFKSMFLSIIMLIGMLMVACSATSIIAISFIEAPQDVYEYQANGVNKVTAKIKLEYNNSVPVIVNIADASKYGVKVSGDTFTGPGVYTLVVSYGAITASYEYTVVAEDDISLLYDGGKGISGNPYLISNPVQLSNIRYALDKEFRLTKDIDLAGFEWVPIGEVNVKEINYQNVKYTVITGFSGTLDGNNKQILNLKVNNSTDIPFGLFSGIKGTTSKKAKIFDLTINVDIFIEDYTVGSIAHTAEYSELQNITVKGKITGAHVGGLVYCSNDSSFVSCKNYAEIFTSTKPYQGYSEMGGIVSSAGANTALKNCENYGNLTALYYGDNGFSVIGQIVGQNLGANVTYEGHFVGKGVVTGNARSATYGGYFIGFALDQNGVAGTEYKDQYIAAAGHVNRINYICTTVQGYTTFIIGEVTYEDKEGNQYEVKQVSDTTTNVSLIITPKQVD